MKKILKFLAIICALVTSLSLGFTTALAAARTSTVLEDSFSDRNFEGEIDTGKWNATFTTSTQTIKQQDTVENPSLRFIKGQSTGEGIQYGTKQKLANITSVEYSFMIPENSKSTTWISISFIGKLDPTKAGYYLYDAQLMLGCNIGDLGNVMGKWVSVKIVPTSDTTADLWYVYRNEDGTATFTEGRKDQIKGFDFASIEEDASLSDEEKASQTAQKIANEGWSFKNAYLLWGCEGQGEGICLDDIKITTQDGDDPEVVYTNTFESLDFNNKDGDFKAYECGRYAEASLEIAEDNKMLFVQSKKGDRIVSYEKLKKDDSVATFVKCADISFNVKIPSGSSDAIALSFGLLDEEADPTQNGILYLIEADSVSEEAKGRFVEYKDGVVVNEQQTGHLLEKVTTRDGAKIVIEIYKTGQAVVKQNGTVVSDDFEISWYAGNVGFYSPKNNDGTVYIDNVFVENSTYYVPTTKSVTHNFENDFFGNKGFEDFYKTSEGGSIKVQDGKLVWDYCSDFSYFGSAYEYDGFILDYQITSIFVSDKEPNESGYNGGTSPGRWIGIDVGRARKNSHKYGSLMTILFEVNPQAGVDVVNPNFYIDTENSPLEYADVKFNRYQSIPASLLKNIHYDNVSRSEMDVKPEDALCVRWVCDLESESIKLYIKRLGDAEFTLYYEVFIVPTGYVALTCTGFVSFKMDNFSMANTSPIYNVANNEVPETIYPEPETEYIYTKPDVDVNLDEEIKLNLGGKLSWLWFVGGLVIGLGGLGVGVFMAIKVKKSTAKPTAESVDNGEGEEN